MIKTKFLLFAVFLISFATSAQELTCADFKIGKFFIPTTEELEKITVMTNDSISDFRVKMDSTIFKTVIVRQKNTQIEWKNGIGNGNPEYEIIDWINDCTYRLTYDASKSELDEEKKWINDNNGIVVSKTKIEKNCLFYIATMTTNEGQKISQNGMICKE